jgi:UDP-N-acetyl-D-mannosaminuronic acid dehydrogenase
MENLSMKSVCVIGLGYIGLPTAAMFATHGVQVTGVDINDQILETLNRGEIHIQEPGLRELVRQAWASGNLRVSTRPVEAEAFIIAVPTPFNLDKTADMRAVRSAAQSVTPYLRPGNLVVLESTSPPRTTVELVQPILEQSGLRAGADFHLAYSPERVLPGQILHELVENARVIGGVTPESAQAGRNLYAAFVRGEIVLTDATTAEMVKLMENTYRDINIAIANEFSRLGQRFGIDIWEAIRIASLHPRVRILNPGPGVGGHCISVDPWFLVEAAPDLTPLIRTARQVNDGQPAYVVELARRALGGLAGRRIAALGLAYKADVDDLRESPAVEVCHLLAQAGAQVKAFEPYRPQERFEGFETCNSLAQAVEQAELVVLLVGHRQFRELTPETLGELSPARRLVDTVNAWSGHGWQAAGFQVSRLGVGGQAQSSPAA